MRTHKKFPILKSSSADISHTICTSSDCPERKAPTCRSCKYYAKSESVCCYYKSAHVAEFVLPDFCCDEWRENK